MTKRIITISREFGSGGRFIGEEVAKKLGIAYYDKDIIGRSRRDQDFHRSIFRKMQNCRQRKDYLHTLFWGGILQENQWKIWYTKRRER